MGPVLEAADSAVGRFQIVAVTVYSEGSKTDVKMVFKLDTATGKTWFWDNRALKLRDGSLIYFQGWEEATADVTQQLLDAHNAQSPNSPLEKAKDK